MSLGMEVGLGLVHIVLDGDPAPLPQKGQPLNCEHVNYQRLCILYRTLRRYINIVLLLLLLCMTTEQGQKVKGQGHKVTRSRNVSAAITL